MNEKAKALVERLRLMSRCAYRDGTDTEQFLDDAATEIEVLHANAISVEQVAANVFDSMQKKIEASRSATFDILHRYRTEPKEKPRQEHFGALLLRTRKLERDNQSLLSALVALDHAASEVLTVTTETEPSKCKAIERELRGALGRAHAVTYRILEERRLDSVGGGES